MGDETTPGPLPKLIPESLPKSAPPGSRAYRFMDANEILDGVTLTSISVRNGQLTYEFATVSRGQRVDVRPQNKTNPVESHIIIEPGGHVDSELIQR